ncbi:DUF962 domain-containing protein [Tahibacter amnicola]|uniref:DUF962 domain-containing protein n=1 Tax=Tahibacter amnicola TaxID=2976241 RepID=A0ABY6BM18_9GAMM|nr:Mpo1-like protein [Tahibacter amnicola]UXI70537.1 DUF962 domain-containing protein [Tahibacter amnicola]
MKTLTDHLAHYAAYHRDARNIATHFVGIPMIVVSIGILLARPSLIVAGVPLAPATLAVVLAALFYLRLDHRFGLVMAALFVGLLWLAHGVAALPTAIWLGLGIGLFVVGWILQFVGHYFEGRKPAFVDDLSGFIVGPLFVVVEAAFLLGLRPGLRQAIESRVGPVRRGTAIDPARQGH